VNIYSSIKSIVLEHLQTLTAEGFLPEGLSFDAVDVAPTKDASHGDMATNAAMVLAGKSAKKPREIAEKLAERLNGAQEFQKIDIAGPGFINLTLKPEIWQAQILTILQEGVGYGNSTIGKSKKVNIEYVSANPTGPMHVGHGRGAVVGDALALLLMKAGYNVTKEYYINDAGSQINVLTESAFLRYREALGEDIGEIPSGLYPGDYLKTAGEGLAKYYGDKLLKMPSGEAMPLVRRFTLDAMLEMIRDDLRLMGIRHEVFTSEQELRDAGKVDEVVQVLGEKGLLYTGVLEPPKGKEPEDWEPRPQVLFKSSQFGDDTDRPIRKADGGWTYFAPDIAYHLDKYQRGFNDMILILGADHAGYVKRLSAAVKALSDGQAHIDVKLCQLVRLTRNGEPVKMSKRAGTFVTLREVVEEVGKDVFRFIMLTRRNDQPLDFDFAKVMEQSKDNPVFYVQYAHARAMSALRLAGGELPEAVRRSAKPDAGLLAKLSHPAEIDVIRMLAQWPRQVESAALAHEPHRVAFYLQDVAAAFHGLWNKGNEDAGLRFIVKDDLHLTAARLTLVRAVAAVIASGLWVLGVEPVQQM
jgi:arginyl-tRNA synthetase